MDRRVFELIEMPVTLLCKNPSKNKEKRIHQLVMCAVIDGYTDATSELSKFITKLYREKNPNASVVYRTLQPLFDKQNEHYNELCKELNEIEPLREDF